MAEDVRRRSISRGIAVGLGGAAVVLIALSPFNDQLDLSVPALLLLVPIALASLIGGWRASLPVAVAAALGYAFGYVPPIGDVRPHVWRDVVTLVTFVAVGFATGAFAQWPSPGPSSPSASADDGLRDRRRVELLRSVGHDLRNPLHTIQALTGRLMSTTDDDRARQSLAVVAAESQRLDRIVANMLSASRIDAGALLPERAPEDVAALVLATVARLAPGMTQAVTVDVVSDLPDVSVDAVQFDQVLTNLLENAARHGRPDGSVRITAAERGEYVEVVVSDDGPGFAASELVGPTAFRAGSASPGIGLGLAVCQGIVDAHGGWLELANQRTGGARVAVVVPVSRV